MRRFEDGLKEPERRALAVLRAGGSYLEAARVADLSCEAVMALWERSARRAA